MQSTSLGLYNALIKTHHITSRKKIARLKKAAHHYMANGFILIRSGGCPGYMYAEGDQEGIKEWIASVQVQALCFRFLWDTCGSLVLIIEIRGSSTRTINSSVGLLYLSGLPPS